MTRELVTTDGEIIEGGAGLPAIPDGYGDAPLAVALARAEVDQQITTARAYPRDPRRSMNAILSLATLDEQSAEECVYALPRGGKPIKGPSVRLAEIIASQWGNCRVGARVVHVDRIEKYVEAEGVFHDLETNSATTARVRRRISDKHGRLLNEDMIVVTGNAACAIAKRNAILGAVPKAAWRKAFDAVEKVIAGDVKTLAERREGAVKAFAAFGIKPEQLCASLGINSLDDVTVDHLTTLLGMHSALKSGESTVEEMFPKAAGDTPKSIKGKLDAIAGGKQQEGETPKQEAAAQADQSPADDGAAKLTERAQQLLSGFNHAPKGIDTDDPAQVIAYAAGMEAALEGAARRDVPAEYRTDARKAEAAAWQCGHDTATAAAE